MNDLGALYYIDVYKRQAHGLVIDGLGDMIAIEHVRIGDTLSGDKFPGYTFDYCISNPPFGNPWNPQAVSYTHLAVYKRQG